jgi:Phosphoserine phosphatase RsbU, N-terminal domain
VNGPARRFQAAYGTTLEAYLRDPGEARLRNAYELGRWAVEMGLSVLDLASAHHETLRSTLERRGDPETAGRLIDAAGEVFIETLSAYEMVARGFVEAREVALGERRQAAVVRRLSSFLADAALAEDAEDALAEALQLVAEQARELVDAARCDISLAPASDDDVSQPVFSAAAAEAGPRGRGASELLERDLTGLDGRALGTIAVVRRGRRFTAAERAVVYQLAEMTSAALERSHLYRIRGPS